MKTTAEHNCNFVAGVKYWSPNFEFGKFDYWYGNFAVCVLGSPIFDESCVYDRYEIRTSSEWHSRLVLEDVFPIAALLEYFYHTVCNHRIHRLHFATQSSWHLDRCLLRSTRSWCFCKSWRSTNNRNVMESKTVAVSFFASLHADDDRTVRTSCRPMARLWASASC